MQRSSAPIRARSIAGCRSARRMPYARATRGRAASLRGFRRSVTSAIRRRGTQTMRWLRSRRYIGAESAPSSPAAPGFYIRALAGGVSLRRSTTNRCARAWQQRRARIRRSFCTSGLRIAIRRARRELHVRDTYRVVRALEIALAPHVHARERRAAHACERGHRFHAPPFSTFRSPNSTRASRARCERMLDAGLVEEAERIGEAAVAANAVGYPQALGISARLVHAGRNCALAGARDATVCAAPARVVSWRTRRAVAAPGCGRERGTGKARLALEADALSCREACRTRFSPNASDKARAVTVYLVNGFQLRGVVKGFDSVHRAARVRTQDAPRLQARDFDDLARIRTRCRARPRGRLRRSRE